MSTIIRRARISSMEKFDVIVIDNHPCRILETYPNGYNILHVSSIDLFTGAWVERDFDVRQRFDVPHVFIVVYKLVSITDAGYITVVSPEGAVRSGLRLPDNDMGKRLFAEFRQRQIEGGLDVIIRVTVTQSLGEEHITSYGILEKD